MTTDQLLHVLYMCATISFAVTGVLALADRKVDFFSVVIIGVITAVGGGTIRDLLLDAPVFWASDLSYIRFAVLASILTFIAQSFFAHPNVYKLMLYVDGLGVAMFGVGGAMKTLELGFGWPVGPLMLGVITAIGGGLMRDVLTGRKTLLMSDEVYAVPVATGILTMLVTFHFFPELKSEAILAGTIIAFGLRSAAIYWEWRLPAWFTSGPK
jgi:uncharacterized membrane protein YeiH